MPWARMHTAAATRALMSFAAFWGVVAPAAAVLAVDDELCVLEPHAATATHRTQATPSLVSDLIPAVGMGVS